MASFESKPASNHEERVNLSDSKNQTCQQEGGVFVPTSAEEKAVIRKLDYHLMPPIFLFYALSVLDRSNLGNARLAGLPESVDLSGNHYENLATIFYVAYICFQWTAFGFKKFPAHIWISCVIFSIGFLSTMQALAINYPALCTLRFFLGIAEACYAGTPYYLSFFYPREKVGFRAGIFISGAALANAYGGVLGYAISHIKGGLPPWKYLFIIEGIPSCLVAGIAFFFLPDNLGSASFLTEREREIANHYIQRGQTAELHTGIHLREWFAAFKDPLTYIPGLMYFSCNVCFASLPLFVPSIILEIGTFNSVQSNGLSAPPYILTFITILLSCWLSDKFKMRGPFAGGAAFVASIGYLLLATADGAVPRYIGVFLAINIFVSVAILLSWVANSHSTESQRAGGFTILATMGQCGPLLGTNIFPSSQAPYFREGSWVSFAFCMAVVFGSLSYSLLLRRENRRLDRIHGTQSQDVVEQGGNDFRYML